MAITFACPGCRKVLKVADTMAGRKGKCPFCMEIVEVPAEAAILEQISTPSGEEPADAEADGQEAPSQEQQEQDDYVPPPLDPIIEEALVTFTMLSEKPWFAILRELANGPKNIAALCESIRMPKPTASDHLAFLLRKGVVTRQRHEKEMIYSIDRDKIRRAVDVLEQFLRP